MDDDEEMLPATSGCSSSEVVQGIPNQHTENSEAFASELELGPVRPRRVIRLPKRYQDEPPEPLAPVEEPRPAMVRRVILHVRDTIRTAFNAFGLFREYPHRPSYDPDAFVSPDDLTYRARRPRSPDLQPHVPSTSVSEQPPPWPFANMSIYRLMEWRYSGSITKSLQEINRLVRDVLLAEDFKVDDLSKFSMATQNGVLDAKYNAATTHHSDGWRETDVHIEVPTRSSGSSGNSQTFTVTNGLIYRPLIDVIRSAFAEPIAKSFHLYPFKRLRKHSSLQTEERVYDELYTSDAWLKAHDVLQKQSNEPGCELEKVIAALMFSSDATTLASFGTAKAWPLYLYFGNLSKYVRASPNSGACHHIAFIPSLPDSITHFINTIGSFTKTATRSLLTHCRRELMHAVWDIILDDEFINAYQHGIVLKCADGILRRVYPRIFTYSADYPEKIILASIRDKGEFLCPRCLVPKSKLAEVGFVRDMRLRLRTLRTYALDKVRRARELIYLKGKPVDGAGVQRLLKPETLIPTMNAFAKKLGTLGFDHFSMLVVDVMHECELGTWKSVFTHLIRLLFAISPTGQLVAELDHRFRQIPTFGRGIIRQFSGNSSEMKRRAARDFEDLLQCSIPVFEGLFPRQHDALVTTLLYRFAEWHALAKLRMHTESSLSLLDTTSKTLCRVLRQFRDKTAKVYNTVELPKELGARQRRKKNDCSSTGGQSSVPKPKSFNMSTYKFHAICDYARTVMQFGTTDSYTTQIGELAHRVIKAFYSLTNKNNATRQIAKHEVRKRRLQRTAIPGRHTQDVFCPEDNAPRSCDPLLHHYISDTSRNRIDIFAFLRERQGDPAVEHFIQKLKDHLLYRLLNLEYDGEDHIFTDAQRNNVRILDNLLFSPATMQVNYTTYDVRREQDTINPRTHGDVMVLSRETGPGYHPYWYARVLRVLHARVRHCGADARNLSVQHMEILWVRWYGIVPGHRHGSAVARLPKIGFVPESDLSAFGFLDPSLVIRSCHLIPAFVDGRTTDLLRAGQSDGRRSGEVDDWSTYYVNIFADRDMYMRYNGNGIGHCFNLVREEDEVIRDEMEDESGLEEGEEDTVEGEEHDEDQVDVDADDDDEEDNDDEEDEEDDDDDNEVLGNGSGSDSDDRDCDAESTFDYDTDVDDLF
ncbi:hypothetical protein BU15DRAFT_74100 [Melanogaster broomeanus]|nr:hypothetical protein BU15DRAFT_74100 [Melanogaster broomeanus]